MQDSFIAQSRYWSTGTAASDQKEQIEAKISRLDESGLAELKFMRLSVLDRNPQWKDGDPMLNTDGRTIVALKRSNSLTILRLVGSSIRILRW